MLKTHNICLYILIKYVFFVNTLQTSARKAVFWLITQSAISVSILTVVLSWGPLLLTWTVTETRGELRFSCFPCTYRSSGPRLRRPCSDLSFFWFTLRKSKYGSDLYAYFKLLHTSACFLVWMTIRCRGSQWFSLFVVFRFTGFNCPLNFCCVLNLVL